MILIKLEVVDAAGSGVKLEVVESKVDAMDNFLVNHPRGSRCLGPVVVWSASVAYLFLCCLLPSSCISYDLMPCVWFKPLSSPDV